MSWAIFRAALRRVARKARFLGARLAGFSANDVFLLKQLRRRALLKEYLPFRRTHLSPFGFPPEDEPDIGLCERLIAAYARAAETADPRAAMSPLWKRNFAADQRPLVEALDSGDPRRLASLLPSMLRSQIVRGIEPGNLYRGTNWKAHALRLADDLLSLAETVGVEADLRDGIEPVIARIEHALSLRLSHPAVAGAYGLAIGDRLIPASTPNYVHAAIRIRDTLAAHIGRRGSILEIGGGYGGAAYFIDRLLAPARYTIIDLPAINCLQGYFLSTALGAERVGMFGESAASIMILPPQTFDEHRMVDLAFNQNSMPEIPVEAAQFYAEWIRERASIFFSYNHEDIDWSGDFAVTNVSDVLERAGLWRLSRAEGLAKGYFEDVWATPAIGMKNAA